MKQTKNDRVRVRLRYAPKRCGTVVQAGPEQSEVRLDGAHSTQAFINDDLLPVVKRVKARTEGV